MKKRSFTKALFFSIQNTYPIAVSWIPVAIAFGLLVRESGVPFYWAGLSGLLCFSGSGQMLVFSFLAGNAAWGTVLIGAAALSFRHLFYGLSFLERFRRFGAARHYMIYALCDELYSVYCAIDIPEELDEKQVHLACAIVLQFYWVGLSTLFALLGSFLPFDLAGVDFALTALFAVILLDMLLSAETKLPALCALVCGVGCLLLFGPDGFMIPALLLVTTALLLLRRFIDAPGRKENGNE